MKPRFFATQAAFGAWLSRHHADTELWIGFHKKNAGKQGMTYFEAVDEALCWGWIDGIVRRVDDERFMHRFTPRKAKSTWSLVNVAKTKALITAGRMQRPGLAAFEARDAERTGIYSFEQARVVLTRVHRVRFHADAAAWRWFSTQPASYRKAAIHWVNSAKQAETRERRLATLIGDSAKERRLRQYTPWADRSK